MKQQAVNRPRRSVLYMPGSNLRALEKARTLAADVLILDLEDAVAPDAKQLARDQVLAVLAQQGFGQREVVVRVNSHASVWGQEDLQSVARSSVDAVLLPKVESLADIEVAIEILHKAGADTELPIWAMIETPLGVLQAQQIASHQRTQVLVMGTNDLAKELRVPQTPDRLGFMTSLGLSVLAARAYGCDVIDGVFIELDNEAGLLTACQQGKSLGFDGKSLIHPRQLDTANRVFSPSAKELEQASAIVAAWQQASKEAKAVVVVNGRLVEELHVKEAQRIIAMAAAIAAL